MLLFIGGFATCVVCVGGICLWADHDMKKEYARKVYGLQHGKYPEW